MSTKKFTDFPSSSILDNSLGIVGDPVTGQYFHVSYKQEKDYFTSGLNSYDPTQLNNFSSSILLFTSSYITDSSSFNTRILNAGTPVDNVTLKVLNNSASLNLSSSNSWAANINLQATHSMAIGFTSTPTASLEVFKLIPITGSDVMVARITGQNNLQSGARNVFIKFGIGPQGINGYFDINNNGGGNLEFRYGNNFDSLNAAIALPLLIAEDRGIMVGRNSSTVIVNSRLGIGAGTTGLSQINLASGSAPTSPNDGDIWYDTTGSLKIRIQGVTKTFTLS